MTTPTPRSPLGSIVRSGIVTAERMVAVLSVILAASACGASHDATSVPVTPVPPPPPSPSLVVSPATVEDTIGVAAVPIAVRLVRGNDPISGATVQLTVGGSSATKGIVTLAPTVTGNLSSSLTVTTDVTGQVTAFASLGTTAGTGVVLVDVPSLSLHDSVRVAVHPGKLFKVSLSTRDTAVFAGGQLKVGITRVDRSGNATNDAVDVVEAVGVSASGTLGVYVAGTTVMPGRVVLKSALRTDTIAIAVVPADTMVYTAWRLDRSDYIITAVGLDGSIVRTYGTGTTTGPFLHPSWSSDGLRATSNYGGGFGAAGNVARLYIYDSTASRLELAPNTSGLTQRLNAHFTRAGDWIIFVSLDDNYTTGIWRIHPDGTGLEQLLTAPLSGYIYSAYPSPDGKTIFLIKAIPAGKRGFRMDVATRSLTDLGAIDGPISVSPKGDQIAWYDGDGGLHVSALDGSAARLLAAIGIPLTPAAWTRDGAYLIAGSAIVNVATGARVPLTWPKQTTRLYTDPSSRP